ncbi:hypothetical protein AKJ63_01070 [candidate division MSBL1 archaeon SCGC-AAA259D18]|uniref:Uncharacterized protein n=1 Tax=candidate division MSBL1 archaeon SCGC-AAA259D18 TaxID=1698262 RepID=A0A133UBX8_9EURY|nr:hypothetical protein AKJ63_01070 [candidate division MSBL1 archaeon SCGC-AAA259D18]
MQLGPGSDKLSKNFHVTYFSLSYPLNNSLSAKPEIDRIGRQMNDTSDSSKRKLSLLRKLFFF